MGHPLSEVLPNLVVGLREGLEAGLVVALLGAAVRRLRPEAGAAGLRAGTTAGIALMLGGGCALTLTSAAVPGAVQAAIGGALSIAAVGLVTAALVRSTRPEDDTGSHDRAGYLLAAAALAAVSREGLETSLLVWSAVKAARTDAGPLVGAVAGLLLAAVACVLVERSALRAAVRHKAAWVVVPGLVVTAGILAYGVGRLQVSGVLPGAGRTAVDLTGELPGAPAWAEVVRAVTSLSTTMSWGQVVMYAGYLAVAAAFYLRRLERRHAGRTRSLPTPAPEPVERPRRRRRVGLATALTGAVVAGVLGVPFLTTPAGANGSTPVLVAAHACGPTADASQAAGAVVFAVSNTSPRAVDIELRRVGDSAVVSEIEVLGPGTSRALASTLAAGRYSWRCVYDGLPPVSSAPITVAGQTSVAGPPALVPVTSADMARPLAMYRRYLTDRLGVLLGQVATLRTDVRAGRLADARAAWLTAHLTYRTLGAAYDAFGDAGKAVDGLSLGLPGGTGDPAFSGFHKVESILWGPSPDRAALVRSSDALYAAVRRLRDVLPRLTVTANAVSTRAHEILEDTVRFTLTSQDDYGSGSGLASAAADVTATRRLLGLLAPVLSSRRPGLVSRIGAELGTVQQALDAGRNGASWLPVRSLTLPQRERLDAAVGQVLETLSVVPDVLEIRG